MMEHLSVGIELNAVPDIVQALEDARMEKFDFVCIPLVHPRYERDFSGTVDRFEAFTRSDMLLNSNTWSSVVVGKLSSWINPDSDCETMRYNSRKAYKQELAWASHLALPAVLLPPPRYCGASPNFSQLINSSLMGLSNMHLWVRIPTSSMAASVESDSPKSDPWEWWNALRTSCEHHPSLAVALELTADLPDQERLNQWLGEPIRAVIIPTSIFLTNKKGFPTLSKPHQNLLHSFFRFKVQFVLKGAPHHKSKNSHNDYQQYLAYVFSQRVLPTETEQFEGPFLDYLQAPLQPLMDNLESGTYETFEKDPVKYANYEEATYQALVERYEPSQAVTVMVVGAGRGPLVRCVLSAAQRASRVVKVFAVEKNPNAVVTLRALKESLGWGDAVSIIDSDMRVWQAPEQADILVSELLGSFGDNELSPECLDGAQRFLKPGGISIPCWYTSYVAPISSAKLWNEVKTYNDLAHFETPYVVKMHNIHQLAESQPLFTYHHPNQGHPPPPSSSSSSSASPSSSSSSSSTKPSLPTPIAIDNDRYGTLSFRIEQSSTVHGLAGFFDACLYKDVHISINPQNFSTGMFSWFPLYFPLRVPVYVPPGGEITVHLWRLSTRTKVWYEWSLASPIHTTIHNPNGRSYWIGL
eukprot:TRINITY_DN4095_c0_g1_i1.p1 TRINITY_DN4095_c0_g1~~TRINITY_DN4095_c0_g1_i1.p1  ORF type:complete len:640 (+),score=181.99 TRINITY_DN4095_c0_g1_i1:34-1953(+)